MKTFRLLGMALLAILVSMNFTACKYDDDELWENVNSLESRIEILEKQCKELNINITSIQAIVNGLGTGDYITDVTPILEGKEEVGYTITFAQRGKITIYNGKNGSNGVNGASPIIGVKQDLDGIYYWTIDEKWLLNEKGEKVKAQGVDGKDGVDGVNGADGSDGANGADGKDGVTPQLKIENGKWLVSYNNGISWTELTDIANIGSEENIFKGIDISNPDYIVFKLYNDTEFKIPTWSAFEALSLKCEKMNTNIASLQTIVNAINKGDYIKSVTPLMENSQITGYTITFSKAEPIIIYHGKDGNNGASPIIGVKQDTDGHYCWTVNGEWLLDEAGNKIRTSGADGSDGANGADGKDGVTPQLKIENGKWLVSYDNGTSWTELGKATTDNNNTSSFIKIDYTTNEKYVEFTLLDGTVLKFPTWTAFENLQTFCNQMNTNIAALQTIVTASQNNDYIKSVTPFMENGVEIGYTIIFAKSNPITIYHGKDGVNGSDGSNGSNGLNGADGKDGKTPIIGVKKHIDGIYYWTVNNEWLLDEDGNKVKAEGANGSNGSNGTNGKDGITPKLKIEGGYWFVSYDNGSTWTELGKATGKDGDNIFSSVTQDGDNVYFNLVDGTTITISKNGSSTPKPTDYIQFEDANVKALCLKWDTNYDGELSYEEAANVQSLGTTFKENTTIRLFKELQYFTSLTTLEQTFNGCTNLIYINIPINVTNMSNAFYGCSSLISAIVPNGVTDLSYAFYKCKSLVKSNIPSSAINLNYSFYECNKLEGSLLIPNTVTNIDVAFKNCYLINEIKFESGSSITEFTTFKRENIGNWNKGAFDSTFRGCQSIKSFVVPASVEIINLSTFYECTSLETIEFEENSKLKRIVSMAYDGVNTSYRSPFEGCTSLKTFDASNCKEMPTTGGAMQGYTFKDCTNLSVVKLGNSEPPLLSDEYWFYNVSNIDLFVPESSIEKYQNSTTYPWSKLKFKSYNAL